MPRVLFVANFVRNHIKEFHIPSLRLLKEMGWQVDVAARNDCGGPPEIPCCDRFYDVAFERQPFRAGNLRAYRQLREIIDANHYDLIHCHVHVSSALTRLAARKARKKEGSKVLYTVHGFYFFQGGPWVNWIFYPVERFLARYTDVMVAVNHPDLEIARSFSAGEVRYIPGMGVDLTRLCAGEEERRRARAELRREMDIPPEAQVLISVGEVNRNKNHRVVLEAMARMKEARPYYVVVGDGAELEALKGLAETLGLADRVRFPGYRTDVGNYLAMADLFVFPSRREALGIAALEGMAAGLPLVASDLANIREYAADGVTGALVKDPGDAAGFAAAIEGLLSDPEALRRMGQANRQAAMPFTQEAVLPILEDIYRGLTPRTRDRERRAG